MKQIIKISMKYIIRSIVTKMVVKLMDNIFKKKLHKNK